MHVWVALEFIPQIDGLVQDCVSSLALSYWNMVSRTGYQSVNVQPCAHWWSRKGPEEWILWRWSWPKYCWARIYLARQLEGAITLIRDNGTKTFSLDSYSRKNVDMPARASHSALLLSTRRNLVCASDNENFQLKCECPWVTTFQFVWTVSFNPLVRTTFFLFSLAFRLFQLERGNDDPATSEFQLERVSVDLSIGESFPHVPVPIYWLGPHQCGHEGISLINLSRVWQLPSTRNNVGIPVKESFSSEWEWVDLPLSDNFPL